MRLVAFAVALLATSLASAATWYVGPTTCNSNSATCGDTDDADRCCSPQHAIDRSSSGDTIVLHTGTYTGYQSVTVDQTANYSLNVNKTNLTIRKATGETPVISGGGTVNGCVAVNSTGSGLTLDGITCSAHICSSNTTRVGIIYIVGASNVTIRNTTLTVTGSNGTEEYNCGAVRMRGSGTDGILVENSTITGGFKHGIYLDILEGTSGYVFRNNTFTSNGALVGANDANRILIVKQIKAAATGNIVFYNNRATISGSQTKVFTYARENSGSAKLYIFNNIVTGARHYAFYGQEDSCPNETPCSTYYAQNVWFFNNTVTNPFEAVRWPNYYSVLRAFNNIFVGEYGVVASTAPFQDCDAGGCSAHGTGPDTIWSTSTDKFTTNILESNTAILSGSPLVSTAGTVRSSGTLTSRSATTQELTATTTGVLTANADPLGQGAGLCSITAAGQTINCALDINGTDRGTVWDVGADEFGAAPSQTCGNNIKEGTEICDGTDFGTNSCVLSGFAAGTLTCTDCITITTENCTTSGVQRSVMKGVTISGGVLP